MEELDLKKMWKSGERGDDFNYSSQTIARIIKQGPQNIVSRFIKTLTIEKWANVIVLSSAAIYLLIEQFWLLFGAMNVLNLAFFFYYQMLINKLDREFIDSNVMQYLNDVHKIITRFIKHYTIAAWVIVVPVFFVTIYFQQNGFHAYNMGMQTFYWVSFGSLVLAMATVYYILHLMYGKKAKRIKKMIDMLSEEEN